MAQWTILHPIPSVPLKHRVGPHVVEKDQASKLVGQSLRYQAVRRECKPQHPVRQQAMARTSAKLVFDDCIWQAANDEHVAIEYVSFNCISADILEDYDLLSINVRVKTLELV
ncbi:MAG: hypothetical protein ACTS27_01065 [Phycisphaerales bacterium]